MNEEQIVNWLLSEDSFRQILFEPLFENYKTIKSFTELTYPFTTKNKKPGDIDLLLVDPLYPEKAIVFECKKVKAVSQNDKTAKINNLQKIKKGVVQAEFYKHLGFHQSYLIIILLDDGRKYDTPNMVFRTTNMSDTEFYDIPRNQGLSEDIGIIFIKVEQFTGRHFKLTGSYGVCYDRFANKFEQQIELTDKVSELIKGSC